MSPTLSAVRRVTSRSHSPPGVILTDTLSPTLLTDALASDELRSTTVSTTPRSVLRFSTCAFGTGSSTLTLASVFHSPSGRSSDLWSRTTPPDASGASGSASASALAEPDDTRSYTVLVSVLPAPTGDFATLLVTATLYVQSWLRVTDLSTETPGSNPPAPSTATAFPSWSTKSSGSP